MKRAGTLLVLFSGLALVVTAFGHALAGWPPHSASLMQTGVDPDVIRALWSGWHFASASMLAFGAIVLTSVARAHRGHDPDIASLFIIAAACIGFGVVGLLLIGYTPFFPGFIVLGITLGVGTQLLRRS